MLQYKKFGFLGESPRLAKSGQIHFSKIKLSTFSTSGDKRREKSHMLNSVLLDASVLTLRFDTVKCWVTIFFIFEQFYPILYSTLAFVHNIFICIHGYSTPYELNTQQYILKIWNSKCVFIKTVFHLSKKQWKWCINLTHSTIENIWVQYWFLPAEVLITTFLGRQA